MILIGNLREEKQIKKGQLWKEAQLEIPQEKEQGNFSILNMRKVKH
jgi:hypothetical protein